MFVLKIFNLQRPESQCANHVWVSAPVRTWPSGARSSGGSLLTGTEAETNTKEKMNAQKMLRYETMVDGHF